MPRVLTDSDVADFRDRLCAAAERLFAQKGPEAVTMRQLAAELGVSPMTPYRYFEDKEEILAAVRASGFTRFAQALEAARDSERTAAARAEAVGRAYIAFALENPHAYKLMFDMNRPDFGNYPELTEAGERARATMTAHVIDSIAAGDLEGDPELLGVMFWASLHGVVILQLAGMLPPGAALPIGLAMGDAMRKGLRPA